MIPFDIAKEYFPQATDEQIDFILWEYTGFPAFWNGDPETCLRKQLQELKDISDKELKKV